MANPGHGPFGHQEAELEALLRAARPRIAFPPTPEVWPAIERELTAPSRPTRNRRLAARGLNWPLPVRLLASSALVLTLLALALLAFPDLRTAVAERIGLSGVVIRFLDEPPAPTAPAGSALNLGRAVSLAEAEATAGFTLRVPTAPELGSPAGVYVTYGSSHPMVSLVYDAGELLPASQYTGVGALLTQFEGRLDGGMVTKGLMSESAVRPTSVNGEPAFWIDGAAHFFIYKSPTGEVRNEEYRLAGNVLLWEGDGITYRLESELAEEAAVGIAETMRPLATEAGTE